ncbi:17594_t:CDS:1 [Acaulospora colombiana]|uniref:17594_t:CDS:1 n=1 Tax=Acaulospora colombiana TaxID=27376 RepID=A0ACA9NGF3_9GLOM|nr:17594_t:CDS:1 [Acaulospora colombiana]
MSQIKIAERIANGEREEPVKGTPREYLETYRQCWEDDPSKRPNVHEVLNRLLNTEIPSRRKSGDSLSSGNVINIPGSTRPIRARRDSDGGIMNVGGSDDRIFSSSPTESASSDGTLCSITEVDQMSEGSDKNSSNKIH